MTIMIISILIKIPNSILSYLTIRKMYCVSREFCNDIIWPIDVVKLTLCLNTNKEKRYGVMMFTVINEINKISE